MMNSSLFKAAVILVLSVVILFRQDLGTDYFLKGDSDVMVHPIMNAGSHVYPYTATILTLTCLVSMIMVIICFGDALGGG
jgi:uncharacterized membrane protein